MISSFPAWLQSPNASSSRPKLIVVIVVDQMRADYLERFAPYETGGLHFFVARGADFLSANYQHLPTETCPGHTVLLSGRNPAHTGIVANDWYDRAAGKSTYCVADASSPIVGGQDAAVSPRNLIGENFSDWIQAAYPSSQVYSLSLKDRSAIPMAGHKPTGAFWYSTQSGQFISSSYYGSDLPEWVSQFNARRLPDSYAGKDWIPLLDANSPAYRTHEVAAQFPHHMPDSPGAKLAAAVDSSPFGDELLEAFAEAAVTANDLGQHAGASASTDVLELGFSSNDSVGHSYGPDSPEIADEQIRLDRTLGRLVDFLNQRLGEKNVLWVLSADHGAEPAPEAQQELDHNAAAQRIPTAQMVAAVGKQLNAIFHITGDMHWFVFTTDPMLYFDRDELKRHNISLEDASRALVQQVKVPEIAGFYDPSDAAAISGWIGPLIRNSNFPGRSGDVYYLVKEWTLLSSAHSGTSHADPWPYDTHVPLILAGWRIQPARIPAAVHIVDLAPTLAALTRVKIPSGEPIDGKSLQRFLKLGN